MNTPTIQGLGFIQDGSPTCWKAKGHVEGVGWLEAWGATLVEAMEALQAQAATRMTDFTGAGGRTAPASSAPTTDGSGSTTRPLAGASRTPSTPSSCW